MTMLGSPSSLRPGDSGGVIGPWPTAKPEMEVFRGAVYGRAVEEPGKDVERKAGWRGRSIVPGLLNGRARQTPTRLEVGGWAGMVSGQEDLRRAHA